MVHIEIIKLLLRNGYEAFMVGGYPRDKVLNKESFDVDIVTNATVEEIESIFKDKFSNIDYVGKRFGVIIIEGIEVAQYRGEVYNTMSKPDITFVGNLYEDSKRRDFTINALYMDLEGNIRDPQGGLEDLSNKVLRSVGSASDRFFEDPSRILRALYLSAKLDFNIDEDLSRSIKEHKYLLDEVHSELKGKIINKALTSGNILGFVNLLCEFDILDKVFDNNTWESDSLEYFLNFYPKDSNIIDILSLIYFGTDLEIIRKDLMDLGLGKKVYNKVCNVVDAFSNFSDIANIEWIRFISYKVNSKEEILEIVNHTVNLNSSLNGYIINSKSIDKVKDILNNRIFYKDELIIDGNFLINKGFKGKDIGLILDKLVEKNINDYEGIEDFIVNDSNWK